MDQDQFQHKIDQYNKWVDELKGIQWWEWCYLMGMIILVGVLVYLIKG